MNNKIIIIIIFIILLISSTVILKDEEKLEVITSNFSDKYFLIFFTIVVVITIYGSLSKNKRFRVAIEIGAIAFITSYFSRLNMSYSVFFVSVIFAYISNSHRFES